MALLLRSRFRDVSELRWVGFWSRYHAVESGLLGQRATWAMICGYEKKKKKLETEISSDDVLTFCNSINSTLRQEREAEQLISDFR